MNQFGQWDIKDKMLETIFSKIKIQNFGKWSFLFKLPSCLNDWQLSCDHGDQLKEWWVWLCSVLSMNNWKWLPSNPFLYGKFKFYIEKASVIRYSVIFSQNYSTNYIVVRVCVHVNTGDLVWELISLCVLNIIFNAPSW